MARTRRGCIIGIVVTVAVFAVAGPWIYQVTRAVMDAKKAGILDDVLTDKYQAGRETNLKAIQKALAQSADSDGTFPEAGKWMDAAVLRLKTSDISADEAKAKLRIPGLNKGDSAYGYAINDAVAGKSPDEFKGKEKTVLVYESGQTGWNAHGDPTKDGKKGGKGVTLAGDVVSLGK